MFNSHGFIVTFYIQNQCRFSHLGLLYDTTEINFLTIWFGHILLSFLTFRSPKTDMNTKESSIVLFLFWSIWQSQFFHCLLIPEHRICKLVLVTSTRLLLSNDPEKKDYKTRIHSLGYTLVDRKIWKWEREQEYDWSSACSLYSIMYTRWISAAVI